MVRLSIIILAYNHHLKVQRCYQSVLSTTDPAHTEVLIQDDASPEYNGELLWGPVCQRNSPNLGFPGSSNAGVKRARGEVVLLLNQDTFATTRGWDTQLMALFDEHPQCGIVGPTLLFPDGRVQSVGGLFDAACQPFHEALGYANPDWAPIAVPRQMSWITGAAFAVRRGMWNDLGGFDTEYGRGYFEDVDCCARAVLHGYEVWHEPRVRLFHEVGSTGGNPSFMENARLFKRRWVDTGYVKPDTNVIKVRFWL